MLHTAIRALCAAVMFSLGPFVVAQQAGMPPSATGTSAAAAGTPANPATGKRQPPKPAKQAASGGGPDKVWVNLNSSTYHCPGDRYYGKTANGRYMTEPTARSAGAKGAGGKTCFAGK